MTAPIYLDGDALVLSMLAEFGRDMIVHRTASGTGAVTLTTVRGITINPFSYVVHPETLEPVDERIIFDSRFAIKKTDTIVRGTDKFQVMRVDPIQPADLVMGYRAELRRA